MALWYYDPSKPLCYVGLVAFAIVTAYHVFMICKFKSLYFLPFIIGGASQVGGYGARIASADNKEALGAYIGQSLLLLLPPIFYAASIYMVLKKVIVHERAEQYSIMGVKNMTKIFVTFDCISLFVQASGGGLQATSGDISKYGQWIVVAGLIVQVFAFGYYMLVAVRFQTHIRKASERGIYHGRTMNLGGGLFNFIRLAHVERILAALHISSALIMVRSIYRLAEYIEGREGWLATHEWTFYIFDTLTMFLVMVVLAAIYPPQELEKSASQDGAATMMQTRSSSPLQKNEMA